MVFSPQACPFFRSASVQVIGRPVGPEDQARTRIGDLDAIAGRLVDIEEERLLDRVLVRPGLDEDAVLQEDVGGPQHVLALIDDIGDVVEPAGGARMVLGEGDVVALVVDGEPATAEPAVVEHDLFGDAAAERLDQELLDRPDIGGKQVDMVEPPDGDAPAVIALRHVLQRRSFALGSFVDAGVPVELEDVTVRIAEPVGTAMAEIALGPADAAAHLLDHLDPACQRCLRRGAVGDMAHAGRVRPRQLQRVELVVVEGPKIDRAALPTALRQPVDIHEEVETLLELVRENLDMPEMGDVEAGFAIFHPVLPCGPVCDAVRDLAAASHGPCRTGMRRFALLACRGAGQRLNCSTPSRPSNKSWRNSYKKMAGRLDKPPSPPARDALRMKGMARHCRSAGCSSPGTGRPGMVVRLPSPPSRGIGENGGARGSAAIRDG